MNFQECLKDGIVAEDIVLKHIREKYPLAHRIEGYCKEWDIVIPELGIGVEVKYDIQSEKTGNFLFETLCDGKISGLSTSRSSWWAIVDTQHIHYIILENIFNSICKHSIGIKNFMGEIQTGVPIPMSGYLIKKDLIQYTSVRY